MASEQKDAGTAESNERVNYLALAERLDAIWGDDAVSRNAINDAAAALREAHAEIERQKDAWDAAITHANPVTGELEKADTEVERLRALLAHIYDNLNDMPISDKWAREVCDRIYAELGDRHD